MAAKVIKIIPLNMGEEHIFKDKGIASIRCAFDLSKACTPDCAACEMVGVDRRAECNRANPSFVIGAIDE
jgi:hypothetical protein